MKKITEQIKNTQTAFYEELHKVATDHDLETLRIGFLGRNGVITELMQELKALSLEEKRICGPLMNDLKSKLQESFLDKQQQLEREKNNREDDQMINFDVTAGLDTAPRGSLHLYSQVTDELEDIFTSMGYTTHDGPEIETDHYNFTALNIGPNHPARDMHDTFWLKNFGNRLLRTHTSTIQIHALEKQNFPLAVFAPGRVYRNEATDASHGFMFMQGECLYVAKDVSIAQLLATAQTFLKAFFKSENLAIRVRPGYFPFVEPGVEIDASCPFCTNGCSTCKQTCWIELMGAGLIHPNVLRACAINPEQYRGFAMGFGIARMAMIKYGINDIRLLQTNKRNFLQQFNRFG